MKYRVLIREVHISHREVEASSREEALAKASDTDMDYCEYSHTLPQDTWTVEDENGKQIDQVS